MNHLCLRSDWLRLWDDDRTQFRGEWLGQHAPKTSASSTQGDALARSEIDKTKPPSSRASRVAIGSC
jgi:hypothetical protein